MEGESSRGAYEACLTGLLETGPCWGGRSCVAGLAVLDVKGSVLYQRRVDPGIPCHESVGLLSGEEGQGLVAAVEGLRDDGVCEVGRLCCSGVWYRVFGGTPRGIYAVGPGKKLGMILRALPCVSHYLLVLYRRPYLAQQVVPHVEKFIDEFWDQRRGGP